MRLEQPCSYTQDHLLELKIHRTEISQLHKEFEINRDLCRVCKAMGSYNMKNQI